MRKAILFATVLGKAVSYNIGVLDDNITADDFMLAYADNQDQAMEFIVEIESNIVPAKIYQLATEELVSVKKIIMNHNSTKKVSAILAITQNGNTLIEDVFSVNERDVSAFVNTWKTNTAEAMAKYAINLLDVDNADIHIIDWSIINVTPKKTKKRSAKEIESDLQGVDLGMTAISSEQDECFELESLEVETSDM